MKVNAWLVAILTTGILFAVSTESSAQKIGQTPLKANPYRDDGGSCVYDRNGTLVHTPKGKTCQDRTNHLDKAKTDEPTTLLEGFPPALREPLRQLLGDHEHISTELTELRQLIQNGSRAEALERADKVGLEIAEHRRREEDFIKEVAEHRAKH